MTARRDWWVGHDGSMTYSLSVVVNGEQLAARLTVSEAERRLQAPLPPDVIELQLRRQLMVELEDRLLGPVRR